MDIYVNNEKLEFELENEKNVMDVVNALSKHFSNEQPQKFITSIVIDGKEYSYADENGLIGLLLNNIQKIEFEFNDIVGVSLLSIRQISLYLDFINEITERNVWDEAYTKVIDSLNWMKQGVNQIVSIFGADKDDLTSLKNRFQTRYQNLEQIFLSLQESDFPLKEERLTQIQMSIKDVQGILLTFFNSLHISDQTGSDTYLEDIDVINHILDKLMPLLTQVPVYLQKGDDRLAMEVVEMLTTVLDKSITLFMGVKQKLYDGFDSLSVNGESFELYFTKMTDNLKELMQAMESKDSIMIGDLIEYEFIPHLEDLSKILSKLKESLLVKIN